MRYTLILLALACLPALAYGQEYERQDILVWVSDILSQSIDGEMLIFTTYITNTGSEPITVNIESLGWNNGSFASNICNMDTRIAPGQAERVVGCFPDEHEDPAFIMVSRQSEEPLPAHILPFVSGACERAGLSAISCQPVQSISHLDGFSGVPATIYTPDNPPLGPVLEYAYYNLNQLVLVFDRPILLGDGWERQIGLTSYGDVKMWTWSGEWDGNQILENVMILRTPGWVESSLTSPTHIFSSVTVGHGTLVDAEGNPSEWAVVPVTTSDAVVMSRDVADVQYEPSQAGAEEATAETRDTITLTPISFVPPKPTPISFVPPKVYLQHANLAEQDLSGAYLGRADLTGASLYNADLTDADLYGANLSGANLYGANLTGTDLRSTNLSGAGLRYADLTGAYLTSANLKGATLVGADLTGAYLTGADLTGTDLTGASLEWAFLNHADLTGADLTGASLNWADLKQADLTGANLTGAFLWNADLMLADLRGANLTGAYLTGVDLRLVGLYGVDLTGAYFGEALLADDNMGWADPDQVDLTGAYVAVYLPDADPPEDNLPEDNLPGADLDGIDLTDADLAGRDLVGADLRYADLAGRDLTGANLTGADLYGADLSGADLTDTDLSGANLYGADLTSDDLIFLFGDLTSDDPTGTDLSRADLRYADLSGRDLSGANLYGANLTGANLVEASLWGADLRGADLRGAEMSFAKLRGADFRYADLRGAEMIFVDLYGANLYGADVRGTLSRAVDLLGVEAYVDRYFEASEEAAEREAAREGTREAVIEDLVHDLVNQRRAEMGIHAVERLWEVDITALSHSEDMAKRGYFSHNTPEGLTPADRAIRSWFGCDGGENLGHLTFGGDAFGAEQLANMMVDSWMDSPGHRQNLLNIGHLHTGIGVAFGDGGSVYATQLFC